MPDRPLITLTTDFGMQDWYVASMKAAILRLCPAARLIDVTHGIAPGDLLAGAITIERAIRDFPPGTLHLAVIDPGVGSDRRILVVRLVGHLVVCPDNGLITWAFRRHGGGQAHELTWRPQDSSCTFHGRDIMAPAIAQLACGQPLEALARPIADPVLLPVAPAEAPGRGGRVIHFDRFGNAMTNIPEDLARGGPWASVVVAGRDVGPVRQTYAQVPAGQALALIGSSGMLEVAVRDGSARKLLGLRIGDEVRLESGPEPSPADRLRQLDKQRLWHPFTPMKQWLESDPLVIVAAEGMRLIDSDGNRYLDGVSSLWCNVHGHRVPEIDQAIRRQLDRVAHTTMLGLASEPAILLADRLMQLVPPSLAKVFYSDSGATATEIAFKLAAQYWHNVGRPEKCEFVGFAQAYHGDTVGAMSVGRVEAFHRPYFPLLFEVHFAPTPFVYRSDTPGDPEAVKRACLAELERILQKHHERIAAIAIEPIVQGAAGMIVQPPGFLAEVQRLARQYETLLIADEVAVGFGRTGRMFACEHEDVRPDLMCVGKGISGGYLPLAATFASQRIFDAFLGEPWEGRTFYHGHTYTGNPLACAAALASLDLFAANGLLAHIQSAAAALAARLQPLRALRHVGDMRQKGLMAGIELVADPASRRPFDPRLRMGHRVCDRIRRRGVILRPLGDVVVLMPPLAMPWPDLESIVAAVEAEVAALQAPAAQA